MCGHNFFWLQAAFRIRDVLIWFQILGSVHPLHWITDPDPDPAIFSRGLEGTLTKIMFFILKAFFLINCTEGTFT